MRTFLRVAGMSLAHIIGMLYGRADRWWAWISVMLIAGVFHVLASRPDWAAPSREVAFGFLEFCVISAAMLLIRRRFSDA